MKKYFAEFVGTMALVIFGCGTAMLVGCDSNLGSGYLLTALAFGLTIVGMAYCIGNVSGCHINPAVSIGCLVSKRMTVFDFIGYVISQGLGAIAGASVLAIIFRSGHIKDMTGAYGSNGLAGVNGNPITGLIVEAALTFFFVLIILGVTDENYNHGSFAGLIIGLSLVLIHILGIGLTGTSVNPARSFGPAIIAAMTGNVEPFQSLWVFIVAPLVGGIVAALFYNFIAKENK